MVFQVVFISFCIHISLFIEISTYNLPRCRILSTNPLPFHTITQISSKYNRIPFSKQYQYKIYARRKNDDDFDAFEEDEPLDFSDLSDPLMDGLGEEEDELLSDSVREDRDGANEEEEDDLTDIDDEEELLRRIKEETSWSLRRKAESLKKVQTRRTWEEEFEDNPLTSSSPTVDYDVEQLRFTKSFVAIANIENNDMLDRRSEAWVHHMQWARRTILHPNSSLNVAWDYTRLSGDSSYPEGQVIAFHANDSSVVIDYLQSEPLAIYKGVSSWRLFEMHNEDHENVTWYLSHPIIFVGYDGSDNKEWIDTLKQSKEYHISYNSGIRISQFAELEELDLSPHQNENSKQNKKENKKGLLIVLNSKTLRRAKNYIANEPLMKAGLIKQSVLSPMNIQDVSGLHHVMPRSFSEKELLDQIHYMDPEDLLRMPVPDLPGLENHSQANDYILSMLKEMNISYGYTRWTWSGVYDNEISESMVNNWNEEMIKAQKIRMQSYEEIGLSSSSTTIGEEMGGYEDSSAPTDDVNDMEVE